MHSLFEIVASDKTKAKVDFEVGSSIGYMQMNLLSSTTNNYKTTERSEPAPPVDGGFVSSLPSSMNAEVPC